MILIVLLFGIAVSACALAVIAGLVWKAVKDDTGADQLWTNQGRKLVPPRSPARRRKP